MAKGHKADCFFKIGDPLCGPCTCFFHDDVASSSPPISELKEGVKFDSGKPRTDLLPFDALLGVADVLHYGAQKYADRNWEKGMKWGRLSGALMRHLFLWMMGEETDEESKKHHLAHCACCALMLYALVLRKVGTDDRLRGG